MTHKHPPSYQVGMIGLGTMGRNLLLNMADHGYSVAGFDKNPAQVEKLNKEGSGKKVAGFNTLESFVENLSTPRIVIMLVPAGKIVDQVINDLVPLLAKGDLIIDGGNSKFTDTDLRASVLEKQGIHFFGMGISGGEEGARKGPSMMPGGDIQAYQHVKPILEQIAARVKGEPCVTYIGPGASGHFVKMVHNGIEYALMQLIAETYELLKKGLQLNNHQIHEVFAKWNEGRLQSFLLEITKDIFAFRLPKSDRLLLDEIKDEAKAKGTGKWTSQFAMELQLPVPAIDMAVSMRDLSKYKSLRLQMAETYPREDGQALGAFGQAASLEKLEAAFYFSMMVIYGQGMHLLSKASEAYGYGLKLGEIAKIWRGGCIIRAAFLEDIYRAFHKNKELEFLLLDEHIQALVRANLPSAKSIVAEAISGGLAVPVFAACLTYFYSICTADMPTNLIQAQRDYFGAHTYELKGKDGVFHTNWSSALS
ncbi:MAG: NADP-dependent phosphogluconate dehydrogenase [Bacteroidetes bacterium]|nr:MAG: NADP-dependent phosphogluconate dehydrogenase [Bacteroidota bacterium]